MANLANVSAPTISHFESGDKDLQLSTILNILGVLGMVDQRNLVFPEPREFNDRSRDSIVFRGQDGNKEVRCLISREALEDHFQSKSSNILTVFLEHRSKIEQEARRKYLENRLEADGSIMIRTEDL